MAFETLSSIFVRSVPGALNFSLRETSNMQDDPRNRTSGLSGANSLCKALLSARYIAASLEVWDEDLVRFLFISQDSGSNLEQFFVQLWADLESDVGLRKLVQRSPYLPNLTDLDALSPKDTLFKEMLARYRQLAIRAEDMVVQLVCSEVENGLRAHRAETAR